jgi:hypothetical protein
MKKIVFALLFTVAASAQTTISPNMGLPIPIPGVTPGPIWASDINASFTQIDSHNHSAGQGVQIQPNGMNINSDLTFQSNNATNLRTTRFSSQNAPITNTGADVGELYVSGNELYYNDYTGGNQVQITSNGSVNATTSGIASGTATAAFNTGVLTVKSSSTSFGNVALQSVLLANSGNLSNQLTLKAPTLTTSISNTLPIPPASATSIMQMDTSGNMSAALTVDGSSITISGGVMSIGSSANITGSQLSSSANIAGSQLSSSAGILGSQLSASAAIAGSQLSSSAGITPGQLATITQGSSGSSGSFTTSSTGGANVFTAFASSLTANRPYIVSFSGGSIGITGNVTATFTILHGLATISSFTLSGNLGNTSVLTIPCSALNYVGTGGGSGNWNLNVSVSNASYVASVTNCTMNVISF